MFTPDTVCIVAVLYERLFKWPLGMLPVHDSVGQGGQGCAVQQLVPHVVFQHVTWTE